MKILDFDILKYTNPSLLARGFFLCILFGLSTASYSQKVVEKSWDANAFEQIEIITNEVFKITIKTGNTSKIKLISKIEGEHFESLNIGASEKGNTLVLKPTYRPYFIPKNDKLAAHKVISMELILFIPETLEVYINSKIASLEMQGTIKKLNVNLRDGYCLLTNFSGNALLNTKQGDITVYASSKVQGVAISKKGTVKNTLSNEGTFLLKAESVKGNITLLKTRE